jgi:hypothetical protein
MMKKMGRRSSELEHIVNIGDRKEIFSEGENQLFLPFMCNETQAHAL